MSIIAAFVKDPNSTVDYEVDWNAWLDADAVTVSQWIAPAGLTAGASTVTANVTRVFLSGGVAGTDYVVINRVNTAGGRVEDRSILVQVRDK